MGYFLLLRSLILMGAASLAAQSPRGLLVVANSGEDSVALVDLRHPNAVTKIATYKHPQDVVVSPDWTLADVAEMGAPSQENRTRASCDSHAGGPTCWASFVSGGSSQDFAGTEKEMGGEEIAVNQYPCKYPKTFN